MLRNRERPCTTDRTRALAGGSTRCSRPGTCWGTAHETGRCRRKRLRRLSRLLFPEVLRLTCEPTQGRERAGFLTTPLTGAAVGFWALFALSSPSTSTHQYHTAKVFTNVLQAPRSFSYHCLLPLQARLSHPAAQKHQGQRCRNTQGPSTPLREDEGPDLKTFGMHAHRIVWH